MGIIWWFYIGSFLFTLLASILNPAVHVQGTVWGYLRFQYLLFLCSLGLALFLAAFSLRKLVCYLLELPISWKNKRKWRMIAMVFLLLIMVIYLYTDHPSLVIGMGVLFGFREYWIWRRKRRKSEVKSLYH